MNAVQDLALTVEHVKICQEATDASAKQDFLENIAKQVVFHVNSFFCTVWFGFCLAQMY